MEVSKAISMEQSQIFPAVEIVNLKNIIKFVSLSILCHTHAFNVRSNGFSYLLYTSMNLKTAQKAKATKLRIRNLLKIIIVIKIKIS